MNHFFFGYEKSEQNQICAPIIIRDCTHNYQAQARYVLTFVRNKNRLRLCQNKVRERKRYTKTLGSRIGFKIDEFISQRHPIFTKPFCVFFFFLRSTHIQYDEATQHKYHVNYQGKSTIKAVVWFAFTLVWFRVSIVGFGLMI